MFQQISILVILLLGIIQADARHPIESDDPSEENGYRQNTTVQNEQLRTVITQEITEINSVSGRKVEKLLRANNTVYIFAKYANALWDYHILKVLDGDAMQFVPVDLGTYFTQIADAKAENNALYFTMKNGEQYQFNGDELVLTPQ